MQLTCQHMLMLGGGDDVIIFSHLPDELIDYIFRVFHRHNWHKFDFTTRLVNKTLSKLGKNVVHSYNPRLDLSIGMILKMCIFHKGKMSTERLHFLNRAVFWNLQPLQLQRQERIPIEKRTTSIVGVTLKRDLKMTLSEKLSEEQKKKAIHNARYIRTVFSYLDRIGVKAGLPPVSITSSLD